MVDERNGGQVDSAMNGANGLSAQPHANGSGTIENGTNGHHDAVEPNGHASNGTNGIREANGHSLKRGPAQMNDVEVIEVEGESQETSASEIKKVHSMVVDIESPAVEVDFIKSEAFQEAKSGFVFKKDHLGLGYYKDKPVDLKTSLARTLAASWTAHTNTWDQESERKRAIPSDYKPIYFVGADGVTCPTPYAMEEQGEWIAFYRHGQCMRVTDFGVMKYSTHARSQRCNFVRKGKAIRHTLEAVGLSCIQGHLFLSFETRPLTWTTKKPAERSPPFATFADLQRKKMDETIQYKVDDFQHTFRVALMDTVKYLLGTSRLQLNGAEVLKGAQLDAIVANLVRLLKVTEEFFLSNEANAKVSLSDFQQTVIDHLVTTSGIPVDWIHLEPFLMGLSKWQAIHDADKRRSSIANRGRYDHAVVAGDKAVAQEEIDLVAKHLGGNPFLTQQEMMALEAELTTLNLQAGRVVRKRDWIKRVMDDFGKELLRHDVWPQEQLKQVAKLLATHHPVPKKVEAIPPPTKTRRGKDAALITREDVSLYLKAFLTKDPNGSLSLGQVLNQLQTWALSTNRVPLKYYATARFKKEAQAILDSLLGKREKNRGWGGYRLTMQAGVTIDGAPQVPEDVVVLLANHVKRGIKEVQVVADLVALAMRMPYLKAASNTPHLKASYYNKLIEVHTRVDRFAMRQELKRRTLLIKQDIQEGNKRRFEYISQFVESLEGFISASKQALLTEHLARKGTPATPGAGIKKRDTVKYLSESPSYIQGTLRPYQIHGVNTMLTLYDNGMGLILGDEMGLGKTIQTITFMAYLKEVRNVPGPHIIVCPLSVLSNWTDQIKRWYPKLQVILFHGNEKARTEQKEEMRHAFDVCVTTYEIIVAESTYVSHMFFRSVVLDEAHKIKAGDSLVAKAMRNVKGAFKLLLTGTPLQNDLSELYVLLNYLFPDIFDDIDSFASTFDITSSFAKQVNTNMLDKVHLILQPLMLRRIKKDVELNLPPKIETKILTPLTALQKEWYKKIITYEDARGKDGKLRDWATLQSLLMQLRKICNHPYLFDDTVPEDYTLEDLIQSSGKLMVLDKLLRRLKARGSKVLIFSQFTSMLNVLEEFCEMSKFLYLRLDGTCQQAKREVSMAEFNDPTNTERFIFLMSTRAGGLGLNLMAADTVILFDSDWNPQVDNQAMARAHRIGQTKTVNIFRLVSDGSAEKRLVDRAERKLYLDAVVMEKYRVANSSEVAPETLGAMEPELDENGTASLADDIFFGSESLFESSGPITDEDINSLVEQSLKVPTEGDTSAQTIQFRSSSMTTGVKRKASEFDATADFVDIKTVEGGEVLRRGNCYETTIAKDIAEVPEIRNRVERFETVEGCAGYRNARVLKQPKKTVSAPEPKRRKVDESLRPFHCLICRKPEGLTDCRSCPAQFHEDCLMWSTGGMSTCPQHSCVKCGVTTASAGFNYRCAFCPLAYCPACIPKGYCMVYEEAPYESSGAMWIQCASCMEEKKTGKRLLLEDPYYAASLPDFDEHRIERIGQREPDANGPDVLYRAKWLHFPNGFSSFVSTSELLSLTPTAKAALAKFETECRSKETLATETLADLLKGELHAEKQERKAKGKGATPRKTSRKA